MSEAPCTKARLGLVGWIIRHAQVLVFRTMGTHDILLSHLAGMDANDIIDQLRGSAA
jgi:hypothetical protein